MAGKEEKKKPQRRVDAYTFMRRQSGNCDTSYPASDPRSDYYKGEEPK